MDVQPKISEADLDRLARLRGRVALAFTAAMLVVYFGFVLLVAYGRELLGRTIAPGLSVGIALGAFVIGFAWMLTGLYSRWAASRWDVEVDALRAKLGVAPPPLEALPASRAIDVAPVLSDVSAREVVR